MCAIKIQYTTKDQILDMNYAYTNDNDTTNGSIILFWHSHFHWTQFLTIHCCVYTQAETSQYTMYTRTNMVIYR